jgi:hypothetical protein
VSNQTTAPTAGVSSTQPASFLIHFALLPAPWSIAAVSLRMIGLRSPYAAQTALNMVRGDSESKS